MLARYDAGATTGNGRLPAPVDLDDLVLREARRLRERGGVEVDTSAVSGAQVVGHADELVRVVRNLVDNAGRHAAGGVVLALHEGDRWAELSVADDGEGIPKAQRDRIFDRFTRADDARAPAPAPSPACRCRRRRGRADGGVEVPTAAWSC